jgi:putative aldouronate transport system substrate-binding protein
MNNKKISAIIISSLLIVNVLAGCSKAKDTNTPKDQTNTQKPVSKVVIYQNSGKLSSAGKAGSNTEDMEAVRNHIKSKTGIEVEIIVPPKGTETEKLNMLLASNDQLDLFWSVWTELGPKGAIQPVNDLLDKYGANIKKAWPEEAWKGLTDKDGKIWAVPRMTPTVAYPVYVRTDWLKKVGKSMPTTIDELENLLKTFAEKDAAGNGQTIPLVGDVKSLNNSLAAGYLQGGYGNFLDKDGKVKPSEFDPGYKEFLKKMAEWYQKGYLYKESFTVNDDRIRELLKQNKIAVSAKWYSIVSLQEGYLKQNVPEADYGIAKGIKGPKGLVETMTGVSAQGALINKKSKDPVAVMKLLNWEYENIENNIISTYGIKGKNWDYEDEKNHVVKLLNENYIGEFVTGLGLPNERQIFFNDPIKKKHYDYLYKEALDFSRAKKTADYDIVYDAKAINEKVPTKGDVDRMKSEEIVKFITGARPIEQFDQFLNDWLKVGADKLIDAYTEQYNQIKKK